MQGYVDKRALIAEIEKTAVQFISEFDGIAEAEKDLCFDGVDRTPQEMLAYQLGWMHLLLGWEHDEQQGKIVITPAPGYKWNQLGGLYQSFYDRYRQASLSALRETFAATVFELTTWVDSLEETVIFTPGGRKWAASTSCNWPVWKWVHINTVAPFKSFRSKIRKWKKMQSNQC
ncbi:ClbS/DfsB family four-helix bundle protein [Oscillospiraceae bacterium LTW-04]|nr:ClbS/DfsB family four-helix bundle protein [Oscillospiraceae bacterium MB24-C1]